MEKERNKRCLFPLLFQLKLFSYLGDLNSILTVDLFNRVVILREILRRRFFNLSAKSMVLISDGNSEIGAHMYNKSVIIDIFKAFV